jgi:hypothetical protein
MKSQNYNNEIPAEKKAEEMIKRYGFTDAKVQVNQVLYLIESKDVKARNYWEKVLVLLQNPDYLEKTVTEREAKIKKILNKC